MYVSSYVYRLCLCVVCMCVSMGCTVANECKENWSEGSQCSMNVGVEVDVTSAYMQVTKKLLNLHCLHPH